MSEPSPNSGFQAAMSILSHVYFAPILGRLIRARVPDLLDAGAVHSAELAKQTGLHPLSTVRALRALTAFGVFREVAPSTFVNSEVSSLFRDAPGGLRNYALFATSEQFLKSSAGARPQPGDGRAAHDHALGRAYGSTCATTRKITRPSTGDWRDPQRRAGRDCRGLRLDWSDVGCRCRSGSGCAAGFHRHRESRRPGHSVRPAGRAARRGPSANGTGSARTVRVGRRKLLRSDRSQGRRLGSSARFCTTGRMRSAARYWRALNGCMRDSDRLLVIEMVPVPGQPDVGIALLDIAMMTLAVKHGNGR